MTDPFAPPAANDNRRKPRRTRHRMYFDLLDVRTKMLRRDPAQMTPAEVREWHTTLAGIGRMIRDIEPPCG